MKNSLQRLNKKFEQVEESMTLKINELRLDRLRSGKIKLKKLAEPKRPMGHYQEYQYSYKEVL